MLAKESSGGRVSHFPDQVSQLLSESSPGTQYWTDFESGTLSQDMMDLGKLTENHFYEENLRNPQVDQHCIQQPSMTVNQCIENSPALGERLSDFDLAFNNQSAMHGRDIMSYDIHLSNEQVRLLNENISQDGSFAQISLESQQLPMQDSNLFFDPGQLQVDGFCNNVMPLQSHDSTGFVENPPQQLPVPENLDQSYQQLDQASQNLLSEIEDLNPSLQSSKEVYDVLASMTSSFLSTSDAFGMPSDQTSFYNKGQTNDTLQIDPIDIGCRDIDTRTDTNVMDVVLDPLQSDGQQYVGSCDSGIDVSPLATDDPVTDFPPLPAAFDSNLNLLPRDDDCNLFLNFNSDDSVGISDLISLGDPDDCMNDDDSLPEDYLEFIDNYNDASSSQPAENDADNISSMDKTDKSPASPGGGTVKAKRTGGERYLPYFKQRVLKYAAAHTFKEAAARFHVSVDSITLWALKNRQTVIKVSLNSATNANPVFFFSFALLSVCLSFSKTLKNICCCGCGSAGRLVTP